MKIEGRAFVVTGAGSGLGRASAEAIAAAGGTVICVDREARLADAVADAIGASATAIAADVNVSDELEAAVDRAASDGRFAGTVHCAGVPHAERTISHGEPHSIEAFERVIRINLIGTFNVVRITAARLHDVTPSSDGERGVIVMTSSTAAFDGQIGQAAYAASKAGVVGLTLPLARDLARDGIRCVAIAPGPFETPLLASLPERARVALESQVPFPPRLGQPPEFADLAVHVIENTMLNGEVIRLDGALRMGYS